MAEQCAGCGRSDLLQPDIANLQCLACGALTSIATNQVVTPQPQTPDLSNAGYPVVELSTGVQVAEAHEFHPPQPLEAVETVEAPQSAPEAPVVASFVESAVTEPVIDLTGLSIEQVNAIESIVHPGG